MAYWIKNGKQLTDNEYEEYQRRQLEEQERVKQRTEALIQKLGQTYDELTRLLEQSPEAARQVAGETTKDKDLPAAEAEAGAGEHGPEMPMGEAGRDGLRVSADEEAYLLLCPHADDGSAGADAEIASAGGRKCDPGGADADTESDD
jgi:membrane protein involved in colicin uptake